MDSSAGELKAALDQSARQGAASMDANSAARQWLYLERLRLGGLTSSELSAARDEARSAAKQRIEKAGEPMSINDLRDLLSTATERMRLAQSLNIAIDDNSILDTCQLTLVGAARTFADSLGVNAGVFAMPSDAIAGRDRFVVYQDLATLTEIRSDAQLLGLEVSADSLLAETLAQLGLRAESALRDELHKAEIAGDEMAFRDALAEYLFLAQQDGLGVFAGANLPLISYDELGARYGRVAVAASNAPRPARALGKIFHEIDRIGKILDSVPPNVSFPADPIRRANDNLQTSLQAGFSFLSGATRDELLNLLLAGNAGARIQDRMNFPAAIPLWEDPSRISALCDLLAAKCQTDDDSTSAFRAAQSLFEAADRLKATADLPRRKLYLLEAQKFVVSLRAIALAREAAAPPSTADAILAGGIAIDEIAGGLTYNTKARELSGWASGQLRLPGMGASFTLARADFNTGGAFSLSAYGSVDLPGSDANTKVGRFSVTPRRPLSFAYAPANGISVAGGGKLEINGMTFEAWASLDDPEYRFGAAFSGLNFDLANSIRVMIPTWPDAQRFPAAAVRDVNQYVRDLGNSLEELGASIATPPPFREPGAPPEFEPPVDGAQFNALASWASAQIAGASMGAQQNYSNTISTVLRQLEKINARLNQNECQDNVGLREAAAALRVKDRLAKAAEIMRAKTPPENTTELEAKLSLIDASLRAYLECLVSAPGRRDLDVETQAFQLILDKLDREPDGTLQAPPEWRPLLVSLMAYHKRTFADVLTEGGLKTSDGNPAGDGSALKQLSDENLRNLADNLELRRAAALVMTDDSTPIGSTESIGSQGVLILWLERRERLIRQAWDVETTMPIWPEVAPLANVPVDQEMAAKIRAYTDRSRALALDWLEFQAMFTRLGLDGALDGSGMNVLHFAGHNYSRWNPTEDAGVGEIGLGKLVTAESRLGIPITTRAGRLTNGDVRMLLSAPIEEGLYQLHRPLGSYLNSEKEKFYRLGIKRRTIEESPPEVQAAWRRYELAKLNVFESSTNLDLATTADRLEYEVQNYIATPAAKIALPEVLKLMGTLRTLTLAAELKNAGDLKTRFQAALTTLDAPFKAAAAAQKAWWYMAEYADILLDGADTYVRNTATSSKQFFSDTASETARGGVAIVKDLSLLLPGQRPIDLALPGDLRIDEAFGEIRFNRDTHLLAATFGGSISFPEIDANFTLTHLDIDNQGHVAMQATANGPLPRVPGARMNGSVSVTGRFGLGSTGQPPLVLEQFATTGAGTLSLPDGATLNGQFGYDTSTRILELSAHANHLDLKLSDHFVLLDGTAGIRFGGVGTNSFPSSGQFDLGGTFGLIRKSSPAQGQPLTPENFHLAAVNAVARVMIEPEHITLSLPQGKLLLPELFQSDPLPPATNSTRAQIAINQAQPPSVVFDLGAADDQGLRPIQLVTFSGGVTFDHLGLSIPNFKDAGARQFAGSLDFGNLSLNALGAVTAVTAPKLSITNGFVFFPHPVDPTRIEIQASNIQWKLDGYPTGTLRLATDVSLLNLDMFTLAMVGAPNTNFTGLEILPPDVNASLPSLRIFGTLRALLDDTLIGRDPTNAPLAGIPVGKFGAIVGGQVVIHAPIGDALPAIDFSLGDLTLTGDFRVGGASGIKVTGLSAAEPAKIIFSGLDNLFNLADEPGRRFTIALTGKIKQEHMPGFGLGDARLVFFDRNQPPRFEAPETLVYDGSDWDLAKQLPAELREARLHFKQRDLPIIDLLQPRNLEITSTFRVGFPTLADPMIGGGADNVRVTFMDDGTPQVQNLEGIELTLDPGLQIPPIKDIGGTLYLTGFSNPANLMMAGRVGGTINTYKLNFIAAFTATGPLGLALDVNAGQAGIPLPWGFLFTGAGGGISFLNTSADPMDLHSYITAVEGRFQANHNSPPPPASMSWSGFKDWRNKILDQTPVFPPIGTGPKLEVIGPGNYPANDPIGCPVNIPPASANIFGMPHPDQAAYPGRFILKFSSIPEETLNRPIRDGGMGITKESIAASGKRGAELAVALAEQIRAQIQAHAPPVPASLGSGAQRAALDWLDNVELAFAEAFSRDLTNMPVDATAEQIYAAIKEKAYAGVPMQDATLSIRGTFSHAAVASFMNVDGGGTIGTTGTAGVAGHVNFLGLPVGTAELYLSITDANGNPNPQLTGDIRMALGPLELGAVKAALKAEGAITGLAAVALDIAATLAPDVRSRIMAAIDPSFADKSLVEVTDIVRQRVPVDQQAEAILMLHTAFFAQVLHQPPGTLTDQLLGEIASLVDQVNPELVICADSAIKFAGLKLSNGLAGMKFRLRKTGREAYFDVAPAGFIGYGTPIAALTSGIDRASVSYAETFPDVTGLLKRLLNGQLSSPDAIAAEARNQVATMLENSTMTGSYEVSPLGMNLFRAQMRLINPDLVNHPVVRNNNATTSDDWIAPGTGTLTSLPTREQLLLKAVRKNVLADVFWKGNGSNLSDLYDGSVADLQGRTLTHDYFPHGGLAMAAMLDVPRIFTTLPRAEWATLNNPSEQLPARLEALRKIMHDYFGTTVQQGNFMAYVPLPNPPALFKADGTPIIPPPSIHPADLVESLKTFDPNKVNLPRSLWELDKSFAYLNLNGQLIDVPIGEVNMVAYGPDPNTGAPARFAGSVQFPADSWASLLYGPVDLNASVTGQARANRRTIADALADLQTSDTLGTNATDAAIAAALPGLILKTAETMAQDFPRVEVAATLDTIHPPAQWGWPEINPIQGSFKFYAYSPEYISTLPANPTPLQRLQKTGGIAMEGAYQLAGIATVNGQMLIEAPTATHPLPRAFATLSGQTVSLPFGGLDNATVQFDTDTSTFLSINGALHADLDLSAATGWPIHILAGANVSINNRSATFTFNSNGATATVIANYSDPAHPTFQLTGQVAFDSLITQALSIVPQPGTGTKLLVDVAPPGPRLMNARVVVGGLFNQAADLPQLAVDNALNFQAAFIKAPLINAAIQGFSIGNLTWKVQRIGGLLAISAPSGFLRLSALGQNFGVNVGGTIDPAGTYTLTGSSLVNAALAGVSIDTLITPSITFKNGAVDALGTVTGGLLNTSLLPGVTAINNARCTLTPTGVADLLGRATVPNINFGHLKIRPPTGAATLDATLRLGGIELPNGLLFFDPVSATIPIAATPGLMIPLLSATLPTPIWSASGLAGNFGSFNLSSLSFTLERAANPVRYRLRDVAFQSPLPVGFQNLNFAVTGGALDGIDALPSLPITSLPALNVGRFAIENAAGVPNLSVTGINLPAPRLRCVDLWAGQITPPVASLTIPSDGGINITGVAAGDISPALGKLGGFVLKGAQFNVSKIGAAMNLTGFTASLPVPGFVANAVNLTGTIPSAGAITFSGAAIPQLGVDKIVVRGLNDTAISSSLNSDAGLLFNAGTLNVLDLFTATASLGTIVSFAIPPSTAIDTTFATFNFAPNLRGYSFGSSSAKLERVAGVTRLNFTNGALPLPGGPTLASFNGTISSTGVVTLNGSLGNSDFYGFPVTANFALRAGTTSWNTLIAKSGVRAWWRLEESGSTLSIQDSAGVSPALTGSTTSASTRPAVSQPSGFRDGSGFSMRFDGVDDFYSIPDNAALEGGNNMSVACWFKVNDFTKGKSFHTLISKGDDSWRIAQDGTANWISFDCNSTTSQHVLRASSVNVNDGRWHHVVATYDGTAKSLYIDGVLRASENWTGPIRDSSYPVMIGANAQQTNRNWNGWIDEVAFWNKALDAASVFEMYNAGNGLDLNFSGQVNLRGTGSIVTQPFRPSFAGSINNAGEFDFSFNNGSATLLGFGFTDIDLGFSRRLAPTPLVSLTGAATLGALDLAPFGGPPRFNVEFTRSTFNTIATLNAPNQTMSLAGYSSGGAGYDLSFTGNLGATVNISFSNFTFGNLTIAGLGLPSLAGAIQPTGAFAIALPFIDDLTLSGFRCASCGVDFDNSGLYVAGNFALDASLSGFTRNFGSASLSGTIHTDGSHVLAGSGKLQIAGYSTDSMDFTLNSATKQITSSSTPNLHFGSLNMPIQDFSMRANDFKGNMSKGFGPLNGSHLSGHLDTSFSGNIRLSYDFSTGLLNSTCGGTWSWNCANFAVPNSWLPSGSFSIFGGIGDGGSFTVDKNSANVSNFFAPFWQGPNSLFTPAPGWFWGSLSSEGFQIW